MDQADRVPPQGRDIAALFALQQEHRWEAKKSTAKERRDKLERLRSAIVNHSDDATEALNADLRKPRESPMATEVAVCLHDIDEATAHLDDWMAPEEVQPEHARPGSRMRVMYEARGVVALFSAWNFPFELAFQPLVPIIAAGNTAIVKPNEMAPATSALVATIVREAFEPHEVAVVEGGVDVANALLDLPFDHVFFTGSPKVGSLVMAAAARHLSTVTLELGGKCPVIIDGTTDLAVSAKIVAAEKMYNAGQVCLAPDHVWVKTAYRDEFLGHYFAWIGRRLYADGALEPSRMSRLVDERNHDRVQSYIDDAVARGATALHVPGGVVADAASEPTVLIDVPLDACVMKDEIFGPVLPVLTYDDPAEVLDYLRMTGKPLAMYVHSNDDTFVEFILASTSSGGVTVNGGTVHWLETQLPFGGINKSGTGAYHGVHGFRELSHKRAVVIQPPIGS